jgi:2-polyprenyl-3-methyl-5-hydroxy-6-metoxy-1,4-benzoquinol methylase
MQGNVQTHPCKICHAAEASIIGTEDRDGSPLTTVICTGCGLVHTHPVPTLEELTEYYTLHYRQSYKNTHAPKPKHVLRAGQAALERLERLASHVPAGGTLLDVGSGGGEFVYLATKAGYQASGLEPNEGYADYARAQYGIPVQPGTWESATIAEERLDVVTMHHVLEHFQYPLSALIRIHSWLKPGGHLAIDVPDLESRRHSPGTQFHYAHIYNFNHVSLKAVARKAGFTPVDETVQTTSIVFRKTHAPDREMILRNEENYRHLYGMMLSHTRLTHYTRLTPYARLWNRARKYSREALALRAQPSGREILDTLAA